MLEKATRVRVRRVEELVRTELVFAPFTLAFPELCFFPVSLIVFLTDFEPALRPTELLLAADSTSETRTNNAASSAIVASRVHFRHPKVLIRFDAAFDMTINMSEVVEEKNEK